MFYAFCCHYFYCRIWILQNCSFPHLHHSTCCVTPNSRNCFTLLNHNKSSTQQQIMSKVRGALYFIGLVFGAIGSFLILVPWCLLLPFNQFVNVARFRRAYLCFISKTFFSFAAVMIEYICGTKIVMHSSDRKVLDDKGVLMIANHRTRVDWMFAGWSYATLLNVYPQMAFILKRSLKDVPFFGWCMQIMMYIFLERRRDADLPKIQSVVNYLLSHDQDSCVIMFPEGTDLSPSNVIKNNKFAADNCLPPLEYVLYPKPAGFITCLDLFRKYHNITPNDRANKGNNTSDPNPRVLHDITIAYKDHVYGKRTTDASMVKGEFPYALHMLVERIELRNIPSETNATTEWLRQLFLKKERVLKSFYTHSSVVNYSPKHNSHHHKHHNKHDQTESESTTPIAANNTATNEIENWPPVIFSSSDISFPRRLMHIIGVPIYTFSTLALLYYSPLYRYTVLVLIVLFVTSPLFNGFDTLELKMTNNKQVYEATSGGKVFQVLEEEEIVGDKKKN